MPIPLLVLYPHVNRYYPQHEVYGRLQGYECTLSAPDPTFARHSRGGMAFSVHTQSSLLNLGAFGVGQLEHATIPGLDELLRQHQPRVVITYEAFSAISFQVGRSPRRATFRHVVLSDSTSDPRRSLWRYAPTTATFAAGVRHSADLFVAHTSRSREALHELGVPPTRIALVPPGVDLPPAAEPRPRIDDNFRVLFLGSLRRSKGILSLIRAFRSVVRSHPRAELCIAGSGPLSPTLAQATWGLPGTHVVGWVAEPRKLSLLRESDLFVAPSEDEAVLGLVRWEEQTAISAIEAMQSGLPTIGSDSGALPEIIGLSDAVVPQRSPSALQKVIERSIDDPAWIASVRTRQMERARMEFDIEKSGRLLTRALDSLRITN